MLRLIGNIYYSITINKTIQSKIIHVRIKHWTWTNFDYDLGSIYLRINCENNEYKAGDWVFSQQNIVCIYEYFILFIYLQTIATTYL